MAGKDGAPSKSLSYQAAGVLDNTQLGLGALLGWVNRTKAFRPAGRPGHPVLDVGYFASVVDLGHNLGLALCTDGVGSKVLVAEMLQRYDTIGIDCVAMNVNDAICVGAEPISFLDYVAIEQATPRVLEEIAKGLYRGAELADVAIIGGEISQMPDIVRGQAPGRGLDLSGMCAGLVPLDRVNVGREVRPGDVVVGVRSNGIHSNGLTLARQALFDQGRLAPDQRIAELGGTVGEELLRPTHIYVRPVLELLVTRGVPIRALVHVTGDGLLNLTRIAATVGFRLDNLPPPPPIFELIQTTGRVPAREMYYVFNMGIGFCLIVEDDAALLRVVRQVFAAHHFETSIIGNVVADERRRVLLPGQNLVGEGDRFTDL
ncbi:MAG: phosphoribosylformylglycinamidine cyclo-ligase [Candidatus Rokuibacteriota bacterium]